MHPPSLLSLFERPPEGGLYLLYGHPTAHSAAHRLLSQPLLGNSGVMILDAGNLFDPYLISRMAQAAKKNPRELLKKILISRAFTCHQVHALVQSVASRKELPPLVLALGFPATFYDEEVPLGERSKLLSRTVWLLRKISHRGTRVLMTAADPPACVRKPWTDALIHAADAATRIDLQEDGTQRLTWIKKN